MSVAFKAATMTNMYLTKGNIYKVIKQTSASVL